MKRRLDVVGEGSVVIDRTELRGRDILYLQTPSETNPFGVLAWEKPAPVLDYI